MSDLTFRTAVMSDAKTLFEWRNDPLTREMSKNTDPVSWDNHVNWLNSRLARETPTLFIAFMGSAPVGTFRIDHDEISYTVSPAYRGRGVAKAMLTEARQAFGSLRAEIYERNVASLKAARGAGHQVMLIQ